MQQGRLPQLQAALREQGREHVENATVLAAAATLRPAGKTFLPPFAENAFRSACLGPLFARFAVQKGRAVELTQGPFDCRKLGRYHFHVDPALVPSANNHPFQDWLDRLRDYTGTHSLSPAPLVPWPVYHGTVMHALSCCLIGLELYWKALAESVAQELNGDNYARYCALLGRGAYAEEALESIVSALHPDGEEERGGAEMTGGAAAHAQNGSEPDAEESGAGLAMFFHPVVLQAASNVLGRVIVLFDILGVEDVEEDCRRGCPKMMSKRTPGCGRNRQGVYAPWSGAEVYAETAPGGARTTRALPLPPLCMAWENTAQTRIIPLVPAALADFACRVLPDQLLPPLIFPQLHRLEDGSMGSWDIVKRDLVAVDGLKRSKLFSAQV